MLKQDHSDCPNCPVCSTPLQWQDEKQENVVVKSLGACGVCGLFRDEMDGGIGCERIGYYCIRTSWQVKFDKKAHAEEHARAVEEARSIWAYGTARFAWPEEGDTFRLAVIADSLDDVSIAPETVAQLRKTHADAEVAAALVP